MITTPPIEPLATKNGVIYPFPGGQEVFITSGRGPRTPPIAGASSWHPGIDLVVTGDPRVLTPQGGRVIYADNVSGYGLTVVVQTASGHKEQFAHLEEIHVAPGELVPPGQTVGVMGSTGVSTASHLDFVVYKPHMPYLDGNYQDTTADPIEYLTMLQNMEQLPGGVEGVSDYPDTVTNTSDRNSVHDQYSTSYAGYGGRTRTGATYSTPDSVYNNANPQRTARADRNKGSYAFPNNPDHNYGYRAIESDPEYRRALADAGNRLGIPAQWLADVIALESTANHLPSITNELGCVGLVQFCPSGGLADVAQEMGVGENQARSRLANMSRAQQVRWVEYYISRYSNGGRDINTIEDLYSLINVGPRALTMRTSERDRLSDGNATQVQLYAKLGEHVGRRYSLSSDRYTESEGDVHTSAIPGCPECMRMMNAFGTIHPHHEPR